jgi:hypothetical protein
MYAGFRAAPGGPRRLIVGSERSGDAESDIDAQLGRGASAVGGTLSPIKVTTYLHIALIFRRLWDEGLIWQIV